MEKQEGMILALALFGAVFLYMFYLKASNPQDAVSLYLAPPVYESPASLLAAR